MSFHTKNTVQLSNLGKNKGCGNFCSEEICMFRYARHVLHKFKSIDNFRSLQECRATETAGNAAKYLISVAHELPAPIKDFKEAKKWALSKIDRDEAYCAGYVVLVAKQRCRLLTIKHTCHIGQPSIVKQINKFDFSVESPVAQPFLERAIETPSKERNVPERTRLLLPALVMECSTSLFGHAVAHQYDIQRPIGHSNVPLNIIPMVDRALESRMLVSPRQPVSLVVAPEVILGSILLQEDREAAARREALAGTGRPRYPESPRIAPTPLKVLLVHKSGYRVMASVSICADGYSAILETDANGKGGAFFLVASDKLPLDGSPIYLSRTEVIQIRHTPGNIDIVKELLGR